MPNETTDSDFSGFFDGRDLPLDPRSTYCADVDCCPSNLCDSCILLAQSDCDCCDGNAVAVLRPEGLPALVVCAACRADDDAEVEAARWGSWRSASLWFAGARFINVGTDVYKVRFAAGKGGAL